MHNNKYTLHYFQGNMERTMKQYTAKLLLRNDFSFFFLVFFFFGRVTGVISKQVSSLLLFKCHYFFFRHYAFNKETLLTKVSSTKEWNL